MRVGRRKVIPAYKKPPTRNQEISEGQCQRNPQDPIVIRTQSNPLAWPNSRICPRLHLPLFLHCFISVIWVQATEIDAG